MKYHVLYWSLFIPHILVAILAVILAPILPLFATDAWLPTWLSWFQTPDASLDGDSGWKNKQKHPFVNTLPRYFRQVLWLIRNPSYGFDWTVTASKELQGDYTLKGDKDCDRSLGRTTWVYVVCDGFWHFRLYFKYPFTKHCFQLNLGWDIHEKCVRNQYKGKKAKYRFTPHPFKKMI